VNVCSYAFFRSEYSGMESKNAGAARGKFYVNYIPSLIRAHHAVWAPDYDLVIYHDDRIQDLSYRDGQKPYYQAMLKMQEAGLLKLIYFGKSETLCGKGGMMERLNPLFDWDVHRVVVRDVDSLPLPRDRRMVEEAFELGAKAHVIHDSVSHLGTGFLGGTCSFDAVSFRTKFECRSLDELLARGDGLHINYKMHGADQKFLAAYVAPALWGQTIHHTMNGAQYPGAKAVLPVADRTCPQDFLFSHVGGASDAEAAKNWYDSNMPNEAILKAERDTGIV
jgi:hypothetical protein